MTDQKQQPPHPYYDDEISLVDLATTFIRHRRVFYAVFVLVMVAALAFVLLRGHEETSQYTTTLQLSVLPVLGDSEPTGDNQMRVDGRVPTLLAKINSHWLPIAREQFNQEQDGWPGTIRAEAVEDTQLIRLISPGTNLSEESVREAHRLLAGLIINAQNERLAQRTNLLEQQIQAMNAILESRSPESLVAAQAIETRTELQQKAATGEPAEVLSLASKSDNTDSGPSMKLILALGIVLGLMLGIFAAFVAEFGSQVRQAMKKRG
ncbi:YveK family protein [Marinobacter oulmenensis]|uniref:Uncharacterized protein involved in exopolysaccharide biosynthesis n=1 Tax=Marinobacter oulmenensis TaxID=643747 RepID=A0A840UGA2_9GAMM|nr:hypothetical protein [Marinobacter oulmenensis]MBB5322510.1 uncharacterized protein involved in exopolysaccharide biosynthesis [Marinobacter oulmenensis]